LPLKGEDFPVIETVGQKPIGRMGRMKKLFQKGFGIWSGNPDNPDPSLSQRGGGSNDGIFCKQIPAISFYPESAPFAIAGIHVSQP
jgi:hypothetical protein